MVKIEGFDDMQQKLLDPAIRRALRNDTKQTMRDLGVAVDDSITYQVHTDSENKTYFVILNPSIAINEENMAQLQAARTSGNSTSSVGTIGSGGTASTFSTSPIGLGSAMTLSTAGTIGCAGTKKT